MHNLEHSVKFTKLHEKRAKVVAEIYERLVKLFWDSQHFVFSGAHMQQPMQREQFSKSLDKLRDFASFVETHRIYLPEPSFTPLDELVQVLRTSIIDVGVYGQVENPNEQTLKARHEGLMKAVGSFEKEIPSLRRTLEVEFRRLLGD